jgi:hypothetical protein
MTLMNIAPVHMPTHLGKPIEFYNVLTKEFQNLLAERVCATEHCYWRTPSGSLLTCSQISLQGWRRLRNPVQEHDHIILVDCHRRNRGQSSVLSVYALGGKPLFVSHNEIESTHSRAAQFDTWQAALTQAQELAIDLTVVTYSCWSVGHKMFAYRSQALAESVQEHNLEFPQLLTVIG